MPSHMVEDWPLLAQRANATQSRVGDPGNGVLTFYLILNLAPSHFFLPLLIITLLLARARRNILLVNACITWIITGVVSCVLLYSGKQSGPEPPKMLCASQASLLYAVPPMVSTSILALVFQVWNNLVWRPGERTRGVFLSVIVVLPYVVYFTFSAVGAVIASREPNRVSRARRFFYCSIDHEMFSNIVALYAALTLLITLILEVWVGITVYRNHRLLKRTAPVLIGGEKKTTPDDIQFAIRVSIFGLYILIGLSLSLLSIVAPTSSVPDVVFATMGTAVFLVFGTQTKIWLVWADVFKAKDIEKESHVPTLTPYHLDPLPGQQPGMVVVQNPPMYSPGYAGYTTTARTDYGPTPEFSAASSAFPHSRPSLSQSQEKALPLPPLQGSSAQTSPRLLQGPPPMPTLAVATLKRNSSASSYARDPYNTGVPSMAGPVPSLYEVQVGATFEERQQLSQLRGKLPLRTSSNDVDSMFDGAPESYNSQRPLHLASRFSAESNPFS